MRATLEYFHPRYRKCWTMDPVKARRIVDAILENIQVWQEQVGEIEHHAIPGNKIRCLHLMKNLEQARITLERLIRDAEQ